MKLLVYLLQVIISVPLNHFFSGAATQEAAEERAKKTKIESQHIAPIAQDGGSGSKFLYFGTFWFVVVLRSLQNTTLRFQFLYLAKNFNL